MERSLEKSYSEVCKILHLMDEKYVNKIPKKVINLFESNKLKDYEPFINPQISLAEQNLERKTLAILAMLNLNYWCKSQEEKNELLKMYSDNDKKREDKLREKYNPENLFKKKENCAEKEESNMHNQMVEYKEENFLKKILNKIMKFFKR